MIGATYPKIDLENGEGHDGDYFWGVVIMTICRTVVEVNISGNYRPHAAVMTLRTTAGSSSCLDIMGTILKENYALDIWHVM